MDTPSILLKNAVYEPNDEQRIQKVIRACKIITDILPFEKKNEVLLEEPEMIKFLIMCLPILTSPVSMIMDSLIEKFSRNIQFVHSLWDSLDYVSTLEDKRKRNPIKLFQQSIHKLIKLKASGSLDPLGANDMQLGSDRYQYCEEILTHIELIKLKCLDYASEIIVVVIKELKNEIDFTFNPAELFKKFVQNTNFESIIKKTCDVIETIKKSGIGNTNIDGGLLEALKGKKDILKGNLDLKGNDPKDKGNSSTKSGTTTVGSGAHGGGMKSLNTQGGRRRSSTRMKGMDHAKFKAGDKGKNIQHHQDSDGSNEDEEDEEGLGRSDINTKIEEWLATDEVPLIMKNEFMMEAIRSKDNYESLILFILDPQIYLISSVWAKTFPDLMTNANNVNYHGPDSPTKAKSKKFEEKFLMSYVLRSYKAMIALTDLRNFKYIMSIHKTGVEAYFHLLNNSMKKEDGNCNMNHMAKVTEYFLKKEPDISINYILHFNLVFRFVQYIEFPYIQQLLLAIFDCSETSKSMGDENLKKVLKYFKCTAFFNDIAKAILNGEKELDIKKFEVSYKPPGVEELIKLRNDKASSDNKDNTSIGNTGGIDKQQQQLDPKQQQAYQTPIIEEITGFKCDIDGIKAYIRTKQGGGNGSNTVMVINQNNGGKQQVVSSLSSSSLQQKSIKDLKKYPSIAEKLEKIEQINKLKQAELNQKKNSKSTSKQGDLNKVGQAKKPTNPSNNTSVSKSDTSHVLSDRSFGKPLDISIDKISDISKSDQNQIAGANKQKSETSFDSNTNTKARKSSIGLEEEKKSPSNIDRGIKSPEKKVKIKEEASGINTGSGLGTGTIATTTTITTVIQQKGNNETGMEKKVGVNTGRNTNSPKKDVNSKSKSSLLQSDVTKNLKKNSSANVSPSRTSTQDFHPSKPDSKINQKTSRSVRSSLITSPGLLALSNSGPQQPQIQQQQQQSNPQSQQPKGPSLSETNPIDQVKPNEVKPSPQGSTGNPPSLGESKPNDASSSPPLTTATTTINNNDNNKDTLKQSAKKSAAGAQSLAMGFFDDGIITKKGIEQLNSLYPVSTKALIETDIDKEAKKITFTPGYIKANDVYAYSCCEVLEVLIRKSLNSAKENKFKKLLGIPNSDYSLLWITLFESQSPGFFEMMMKNYLFKIKVHHQSEVNSGYAAGNIVNLILENMGTNEYMKKYFNDIHKTCKDLLPFLCKTIISSHAWMERKNLKVYLQSYVVKDPLGAGRLMLVTTLKQIIWNDQDNGYNVLNEINDTCWHTLIIWLYEKKTNNLYNQIFYLVLEKIFEIGNEKLLITILFKINLLSNMSKIINEICVNGVLLKEKHIDSVVYFIACVMKLIKNLIKDKSNYPKLMEQLNSNISWKDLKNEEMLSKIVIKSTKLPDLNIKKNPISNEIKDTKKPIVSNSPSMPKRQSILKDRKK